MTHVWQGFLMTNCSRSFHHELGLMHSTIALLLNGVVPALRQHAISLTGDVASMMGLAHACLSTADCVRTQEALSIFLSL